jgi:DNA-binding MarR family transcriptional regulator
MKGDVAFFFLRDKPAAALLAIRDLDPAYASAVAKEIDSTVPHTLKILAEMEREGLVASAPEGRIRRLFLTDRGQKAAAAVSNLIDALGSERTLWRRLARLEEIVGEARGLPREEAELLIGPLRRDAARLMEAEDEDLRKGAAALDSRIVAALGGGGGEGGEGGRGSK